MQFSRSFILTIALATATPALFQAQTCCASTDAAPKSSASGFAKLTSGKGAMLIPFALFAVLYIRLLTKPSAKQRVDRTWKEYFTKLLSLLDITQITTKEYRELFDQLIVGDQLKFRDYSLRKENEDGNQVTYKDKDIKSYSSGFMGYLDSYIIQNLKKFAEIFDSLKKCNEFAGYVSE
jgi:hypothetical protein